MPAHACADFGIAGGAVAGAILGFILIVTRRVAVGVAPVHPLLALCLLGEVIYRLFHVECDPIWIWIVLRDFILLLILGKIAVTVFPLRGKTPPSARRRVSRTRRNQPAKRPLPSTL